MEDINASVVGAKSLAMGIPEHFTMQSTVKSLLSAIRFMQDIEKHREAIFVSCMRDGLGFYRSVIATIYYITSFCSLNISPGVSEKLMRCVRALKDAPPHHLNRRNIREDLENDDGENSQHEDRHIGSEYTALDGDDYNFYDEDDDDVSDVDDENDSRDTHHWHLWNDLESLASNTTSNEQSAMKSGLYDINSDEAILKPPVLIGRLFFKPAVLHVLGYLYEQYVTCLLEHLEKSIQGTVQDEQTSALRSLNETFETLKTNVFSDNTAVCIWEVVEKVCAISGESLVSLVISDAIRRGCLKNNIFEGCVNIVNKMRFHTNRMPPMVASCVRYLRVRSSTPKINENIESSSIAVDDRSREPDIEEREWATAEEVMSLSRAILGPDCGFTITDEEVRRYQGRDTDEGRSKDNTIPDSDVSSSITPDSDLDPLSHEEVSSKLFPGLEKYSENVSTVFSDVIKRMRREDRRPTKGHKRASGKGVKRSRLSTDVDMEVEGDDDDDVQVIEAPRPRSKNNYDQPESTLESTLDSPLEPARKAARTQNGRVVRRHGKKSMRWKNKRFERKNACLVTCDVEIVGFGVEIVDELYDIMGSDHTRGTGKLLARVWISQENIRDIQSHKK